MLLVKRIWLVHFVIAGPIWQVSLLGPPLRLLANQSVFCFQVPSPHPVSCVQGPHMVTNLPFKISSFFWNHVEGRLIGKLITTALL